MASMSQEQLSAYVLPQYRIRPEIRVHLARLNLSQNKLARKLGISSGFMSQALTGKRCVGPGTREKLMAALPGLAFDDLFEALSDITALDGTNA
jgi:hypothetical protein